MCLDRGVNDRDISFVMHYIKHCCYQLGTAGDGCLARLEIDLNSVSIAELLQYPAESFQRVPLFRKIYASSKADPFHSLKQGSICIADLVYCGRNIVNLVVFTVEMKHHSTDQIG